jgi:hypothetical protein
MSNKLEQFLHEAVGNIRNDREIAKELLDDVVQYMAKDEKRHGEVGPIAAKYVETLQRSNEQLVKVATLISKAAPEAGLTRNDKEEIYEMLKGDV